MLKTQAEKIAACRDWKAELDKMNAPEVPEYNPDEHLQRLKDERAEWGQAWRQWSADEQKEIRNARIDTLDQEIVNVQKIIAAVG